MDQAVRLGRGAVAAVRSAARSLRNPLLTPPPPLRYFHACAMYSGCMYTFGGYNGTERLNDMYEYDFDDGYWTQMEATGDVPSGRSSLVSQVYNNSLFIFGGYNGQVVLNDFYEFRYEPVVIPPPTLIDDLRRLINNKEVSDVTFVVDGFQVHASRAHLAIRSEHFRALLYGGMKESDQTEIELRDISHPVFLKMLEFLCVCWEALSCDPRVPPSPPSPSPSLFQVHGHRLRHLPGRGRAAPDGQRAVPPRPPQGPVRGRHPQVHHRGERHRHLPRRPPPPRRVPQGHLP